LVVEPAGGVDVRCLDAVGGGRARPLNVALEQARGAYLGFLDDDDLALPEMVAAFRAGAARAPGTVLRAVTLAQRWAADARTGEPREPLGPPERLFPDRFDLLTHLHDNSTPICSMALPTARVREAGLRFDDDLPVLEDWHMLVQAAMRFRVFDLSEEVAVYRRTDGGNSSSLVDAEAWSAVRAAVVDRLEDGPCLLPEGTVKRLSDAQFQHEGPPRAVLDVRQVELELREARSEAERTAAELEAVRREYARLLASRSYRSSAPLRAVARRLRTWRRGTFET
jgi:hypothetical protein